MAAKPGSSLIYEIQESNKPNTLDVKEVGSSSAISSSYASLTPIVVKGQTYLLGYNSTASNLDVFEFSGATALGGALDGFEVERLGRIPDPNV